MRATMTNVEFVQLKTEEALIDLTEICGLDTPPQAVILDPPRVGCHPAALEIAPQACPGPRGLCLLRPCIARP